MGIKLFNPATLLDFPNVTELTVLNYDSEMSHFARGVTVLGPQCVM